MTLLQEPAALMKCRDRRRDTDVESLKHSFLNHLRFTLAKVPESATRRDQFVALAMTVRDRLIERWIATHREYHERAGTKRVYYLSLEFLIGRMLGNSLINLNMYDECYQALEEIGYDLEEIRELEEDAGLGNGGLGRLAACFLDSMATLQLPGYGYGIRYDYGMFHQHIRDGHQVEEPDDWLRFGCPWEIARPEHTFRIQYYGRSECYTDAAGCQRFRWVNTHDIVAMPYDVPVPGHANNTVNTLRLFSAKSARGFDLNDFNHGDYMRACENKSRAENITKVLYPEEDMPQGRELRLKQEYLLVSASLQDILGRFLRQNDDLLLLPDRAAIQLNDTHPALAIPELMRLLMDEYGLGWDEAWNVTTRTFAYTNHTVMPEALEKWPVWLMAKLLPRHLQITYEINHRFLKQVAHRYPDDHARIARMSLIEEGGEPRVRMATLAVVGSHSVNGVSELHSRILVEDLLRDFHEFFPGKFNNKTNGITQRRWLRKANAPLAYLIRDAIGDGWVGDLDQLRRLVPLADDPEFRSRWFEVKRLNKDRLAAHVRREQNLILDPDTLFDCQVKRLHEYKRQILNVLHVVTLYNRIRAGATDMVPRTVMLAGKAAPGYYQAKLIVKLVNSIADVVNCDPVAAPLLRVAFLPDYRVSLAERIFPASDLSQQISTAGTEASGTGNMKFALNGALTIGTLDGANIEMLQEIGGDYMFIFGMTTEEVLARKAGGYNPWAIYDSNPELRDAINMIGSGFFNPREPGLFQILVDGLLRHGDPFMVLADYEAYIACQGRVDRAYRDRDWWTRASIINTASMGRFSSDRTIREYAEQIWNVQPVPIRLRAEQQKGA